MRLSTFGRRTDESTSSSFLPNKYKRQAAFVSNLRTRACNGLSAAWRIREDHAAAISTRVRAHSVATNRLRLLTLNTSPEPIVTGNRTFRDQAMSDADRDKAAASVNSYVE